jgi:hypothetical protein
MLDPIVTSLVTAVAAGAVSAFKDEAKDAIKGAYVGLKTLITGKYPTTSTSLARLEEKPALEGRRTSFAEDLQEAGAYNDAELADRAATLIAIVGKEDPDAARVIGVDLKDIEAAAITLRKVKASGAGATGTRIHGATVSGDITIEDVTAEGYSKKA